jgi:hypothetical protein
MTTSQPVRIVLPPDARKLRQIAPPAETLDLSRRPHPCGLGPRHGVPGVAIARCLGLHSAPGSSVLSEFTSPGTGATGFRIRVLEILFNPETGTGAPARRMFCGRASAEAAEKKSRRNVIGISRLTTISRNLFGIWCAQLRAPLRAKVRTWQKGAAALRTFCGRANAPIWRISPGRDVASRSVA